MEGVPYMSDWGTSGVEAWWPVQVSNEVRALVESMNEKQKALDDKVADLERSVPVIVQSCSMHLAADFARPVYLLSVSQSTYNVLISSFTPGKVRDTWSIGTWTLLFPAARCNDTKPYGVLTSSVSFLRQSLVAFPGTIASHHMYCAVCLAALSVVDEHTPLIDYRRDAGNHQKHDRMIVSRFIRC